VYGFVRFSLILFPDSSIYFSPFVYLLAILGIIHASLNATRQTDLKRIIAYSSVAHMNLVVLGIFSFTIIGIEGSILQSISHGFVASGMFLLIGILYDRYHSRLMHYYSGLVHLMPLYSTFFLIFTMANIALPGTSSFIGELMLLIGIFNVNIFACMLSSLGVILCGGYSLWLYNRIIFGNLKIAYTHKFNDLSIREFCIIFPLLFNVFFLGIFPGFFLNLFNVYVSRLLVFSV
jgi:NADH:ubiquinone oxidoreductase subunit 4 (subunit M)